MLKQIWVVARKELRLWGQQVDRWLTLFLLPLLFIGILGSMFSGDSTLTIPIYAANDDTGERGEALIDALLDSKNLDVQVVADRTEADKLVGQGKRMAAVVVPAGFSKALLSDEGGRVDVIVDPAKDEYAKIVLGLSKAGLVRFIVDAEISRALHNGLNNILADQEVQDLAAEDENLFVEFITAGMKGIIARKVLEAIDDPLVRVVNESVAGDTGGPTPTPLHTLAPGFTLMFVFFLVMHLATAVVAEREAGTLRRILVTPVSRGAVLLGKALPSFVLAFVQLVAMFVASNLAFDLDLGNNPLALGLVMVCTAAVVAALGIMIAALVRTQGQAGGLTALVIIVMAAGSGCLAETVVIPGVSYAIPHYWAMLGFKNVMARGLGFPGVWLPCAVLLAMSAVFFAVGVWRFKFE